MVPFLLPLVFASKDMGLAYLDGGSRRQYLSSLLGVSRCFE
jgi:hypothetical protein